MKLVKWKMGFWRHFLLMKKILKWSSNGMWLQGHIQRVGPQELTFWKTRDPRPRTLKLGLKNWEPGPISVLGPGTLKMETTTRDPGPWSGTWNPGPLLNRGLETQNNHLHQAKAIIFFNLLHFVSIKKNILFGFKDLVMGNFFMKVKFKIFIEPIDRLVKKPKTKSRPVIAKFLHHKFRDITHKNNKNLKDQKLV